MSFTNQKTPSLFAETLPLSLQLRSQNKIVDSGFAFIYPGQGAMFPGMGLLFKNEPSFSYFFKLADVLISKKGLPSVSAYTFSPEQLTLEQQEKVESIALFTFEIALTHKLASDGVIPSALTGHSFGEYAALTACGALSFEEGLEAVLTREISLPERNSRGFMIAVASPAKNLKAYLPTDAFTISNINTPTQTVISAAWDKVQLIESKLTEKGIKYKRLTSPQPFHSPSLQPESKQMHEFAKQAIPQTFLRRDFFSSVTHSWFPKGSDIRDHVIDAIGRQLIEPVDFITQIRALAERCEKLVEVGPRPFLMRLIEENSKNSSTKVVFSHDLLKKTDSVSISSNAVERSQVSDSILGKVNSVIAKFTGYSIQDIKFEDRLQEDLGIDSIKTMEICIELVDTLKLPRETLSAVQKVKSVGEVAFQVEHFQKFKASTKTQAQTKNFHVFHEQYIPKELLSTTIPQANDMVTVPVANKIDLSPIAKAQSFPLKHCQFIFSKHDAPYALSPSFFKEFRQLLLLKQIDSSTRIAMVTYSDSEPLSRALLAFLKSIKKEGLIGFATRIVFEGADLPKGNQSKIVFKELYDGVNTDVRYDKRGYRHIKQLAPITEPQNKAITGQTLVALGGAKGITFEWINHLAQQSKWNIFLLGRSPESEPKVQAALEKLRVHSSSVTYLSCDALDKKALSRALDSVIQRHSKIDLLIQGAGLEQSRSFIERTEQEDLMEFQSKVDITQNILELTASLKIPQQILFSSIIARFGNLGQSVYSMANAWAESLWINNPEGTSRICIQWPPWDNVGMTEKPLISELLKSAGVSLISKEQATSLLSQMLSHPVNVVHQHDDTLLYEGPLINWDDLKISQGKMHPHESDLTLSFQMGLKVFPELKDHSIQGKALLPLALSSFWFVALGEKLTQKRLSLKEFTVFRAFEIKQEPQELTIRYKSSESKESDSHLQLWNQDSLVAEGFLGLASSADHGTSLTPVPLDAFFFNSSVQVLSPKDFYHSKLLFHGPHFQFLDSIKLSKNEKGLAQLKSSPQPYLAHSPGLEWISKIDSALQLLGLWGLVCGNFRGLPVGFKEAYFFSDTKETESLTWQMTQVRLNDSHLTADLILVNDEGISTGYIRQARYQKL